MGRSTGLNMSFSDNSDLGTGMCERTQGDTEKPAQYMHPISANLSWSQALSQILALLQFWNAK